MPGGLSAILKQSVFRLAEIWMQFIGSAKQSVYIYLPGGLSAILKQSVFRLAEIWMQFIGLQHLCKGETEWLKWEKLLSAGMKSKCSSSAPQSSQYIFTMPGGLSAILKQSVFRLAEIWMQFIGLQHLCKEETEWLKWEKLLLAGMKSKCSSLALQSSQYIFTCQEDFQPY